MIFGTVVQILQVTIKAMKAQRFLSSLSLLCILLPGVLNGASEGGVEDVRGRYSEWVQLRKTISGEAASWTEDEAIIKDQIAVLEREKESLQGMIDAAEQSSDSAKEERADLLAKRDDAIDAVSVLERKLPDYESRLLVLAASFPKPLLEEVRPLLNRIPKPTESTRQSVGLRIQNIVGILSQMDKFNQGVTVCSEIKDIGEGGTVEVKTIYIGLGIAYFVDRNAQYAGFGEPAPDGWKWNVDPTMAKSVQDLITIYENASKASFITIPVKIN